jgi:hypothetical protein
MSRYVLTGDSHCSSYLKAFRACGRTDLVDGGPIGAANLYYKKFFEPTETDFVFIDPRASSNYERFKKVTKSNGLCDFKGRLLLSVGLSGTSFWGDRFWHKVSRTPHPNKRFISSGAVEHWIWSLQENAIRFYEVCIERGLLVGALAAPPPQKRAKAVSVLGAHEVLSLDFLFRKPLLDMLQHNGIPVIAIDAADETGFLREEFWAKDPHHSNHKLGPLLVEAIEREFR